MFASPLRARARWAVCFLAFLAVDGAEAAKWQEAASGASGTIYYVDTDSIRRDGSTTSATVRIEYPQMQFTSAGEGYTSAINAYRFNCPAREFVVMEAKLYVNGDRLVTTQRRTTSGWDKAQTGTVAESLLVTICGQRQAQAAPPPSAATSPARSKAGMTSISRDEDEEWLVADETVSVTGSKFMAVAFQEYVKPLPDRASGKQVKTIGWRVEGDCSRSEFRITLKRAFDANLDLVREFELSAEDRSVRQPASDTIAFAIIEHVCESKGFKVSGAPAAPSTRGSQRPAAGDTPPARGSRASGSAFAVSPAGHLLTNNHVVKDCEQVWVSAPGVPRSSGQVMARDDRNDLAIVKAPLRTTAFATFRTTPVRAGESVVALGYPLKGLLASEVNVSTGTVSALAGLQNDTTKIQISAPIQPGNSGGPVLDSTGATAALVVEKLDALAVAKVTGGVLPEGVAFGIKGEVATLFLRSAGVEPTMAPPSGTQLTAPDIAQRGKPFTYLLECEAGR